MRIRWAVAALGVVALAAVAVNFYMPWLAVDAPMRPAADGGSTTLSCPADARAANLDFTLKDIQGRDVTLSQYKGKVLLVDFWATWCEPCKVEIPGFVDLYAKYKSQGFEPVGILVMDETANVKPFAEKFKMNYPVLDGNGHDDLLEALGPVVGLPTTVLISRDGRICATHAGYAPKETFEEEIQALL